MKKNWSSHLDSSGRASMVDVSDKEVTRRTARAEGTISMSTMAMEALDSGACAKGDVLAVARVAGIMAAKETSRLIPLCHPIPLSKVSLEFHFDEGCRVRAVSTAVTLAPTGVEMEALTAVSTALLTIYDMLKGTDRAMEISGIRLLEKEGGRSGRYERER